MKRIAIVTGATSGVGREFVRQLDGALYGKLDETWAVARDAEELEEVSRATYAYVRPFACDLTQDASLAQLRRALAVEEDVRVLWLVNSAGTGWFGRQQDADPQAICDMVRLNCLALTELCEMALPYMASGSRIVNMASVAAWLPLPQMGLYAATKSFVLDVTRALNEDLAGTGISACAVCPKALRTRFWDKAGSASGLGMALGTESVYDVVRKAIAAAEAGRGCVITSPDMVAVCAAAKLLPYGVLAGIGKLVLAGSARPKASERPVTPDEAMAAAE